MSKTTYQLMHIFVCVQLQEQLDRFMKMNAELRHKQNVLQAQLKGTVERKADMEADLKEKSKEIENLQALLDRTNSNSPVCIQCFSLSFQLMSGEARHTVIWFSTPMYNSVPVSARYFL